MQWIARFPIIACHGKELGQVRNALDLDSDLPRAA